MTEHEPRPAPAELATAPAPTVCAPAPHGGEVPAEVNGTASPAPVSVSSHSSEADSKHSPPPKAHENAVTVITRAPLLSPATPQLGQWANLIRGRRLAHFELEEPLGVGGMAAVIRARDTLLDRIVALKILPPEMAADAENIQRFHNEARSAAQLDHENIARVFFYGEDQGLHFIAFEYVDGETLQQRLEQQATLSVPEALQITLQIASGLVHAAARGMVHRDIKPSNIIVSKSGRAKLVDMGLAKCLSKHADRGLTQSGMTLGTFDYISPEQALDPRAADCRSDIYSLGCSLYQMLTGRPPVPEGTAARKLHAHQSELPIDPRQLNPDIPLEVAAVLSRMIAKEPQKRYQRPEHLVQHLLQLLGRYGQPAVLPVDQGQLFVDTILPRPSKRDHDVRFLVALCLLLVWLILQRLLFSSPTPATLPSFGYSSTAADTANGERPRVPAATEKAPAPSASVNQPKTVQTAAELQEALERFSGDGTIQLEGGVFDLTPAPGSPAEAALFFQGGNLTLEGRAERRPILRLRAPALGMGVENVLLRQQGGTLTLRRLRIELEGGPGFTPLTALVMQGGHLCLEECEFVQKDDLGLLGGDAVLTSLRAEKAPAGRTSRSLVDCKQCIFYGGFQGLQLEESTFVQLTNCVFGAYRQPFLLRNRQTGTALDRIDLEMIGCSCLLTGKAFFITEGAPCRLVMRRTVVSVPVSTAMRSKPYLLLLQGDRRDRSELHLAGNYLHGLQGIVAVQQRGGEPAVMAATLDDLAEHKPLFQDDGSILTETSPWFQSDPQRGLSALDPRSAQTAFRLQTSLRDLRLTSPERIKGTLSVLGQDMYPGPLEELPPVPTAMPAVNPRELIVDGQGMKPGHYVNLSSALGAVETDKEEITILLKVNGLQPIRALLDVGNRQIVLKAAPGYKPELALSPEAVTPADGETALFRVHDGLLHLEQLGLRLDSTPGEKKPHQSLITITGTGRCRLHACQATLQGDLDGRTAVLSLSDPTGAMSGMGGRMPRAGQPSIEMEDAFVRGRGDFLAVRASRPFQLDVRNAVVVLFGSLLTIDGNRVEAGALTDSARVSLERLTAYVTTSLITLKSSVTQSLHVPLQMTPAASCLLVLPDGNPLVRVDGALNEMDLKRKLIWQGKGNTYSTTGSLLVWQSTDRTAMPRQYTREGWGELWGRDEEDPHYARDVKFAGSLPLLSSFADLTPADLRISSLDPPDLEVSQPGAELRRIFCLSSKVRE